MSSETASASGPRLKGWLLQMPIGKSESVTSIGLANYYSGGTIRMENGNAHAPIHKLDKPAKASLIVRAAKELTLFLRSPPEGFVAEEEEGRYFRVRFTRLEGGSSR